jgi:glyoxylate reductase
MKVYITRPIVKAAQELLEKENIQVIVGPEEGSTYDMIKRHIQEVDGIICMLSDKIDQELINSSTTIKVIANYAVGFDNINLDAAKEKNIAVGNTPGVLTEATAECALALLMGVQRQLKASERYINNDKWKTWHPTDLMGHNLASRKIGIVGMGRIGYEFARICHQGFGSEIYYTHTREHDQANSNLKAIKLTVEELFKTCDVVSLHCPLKDSTLELVDKKLLEITPEHFILINTARGKVVKQDDLVEALNNGTVWGAGLDVTDPEPLDKTHPLYAHDRCIILPHLGSATWESRTAMAKIAANNVIAGLKGEPLPHSVFS